MDILVSYHGFPQIVSFLGEALRSGDVAMLLHRNLYINDLEWSGKMEGNHIVSFWKHLF